MTAPTGLVRCRGSPRFAFNWAADRVSSRPMDWASIPSDHARIAIAVSITAAAIALQHFWRLSRIGAGWAPARRHAILKAGAGVILAGSAALGALLHAGAGPPLPFGLGSPGTVLPTLAAAVALLWGATLLASRQPAFQRDYPEAPLSAFEWPTWTENALAWAVYLFGYELLFRGLCLHVLAERLGLVPGVAVTTAIYVVAHLPKSLMESLGSFPMGVLFAWLALRGESVLYPWLLHVSMALFADTIALRARRST